MTEVMTPDQLEAALRAIGRERYHDRHPFHGLLHNGKLNRGQVQAWALNRYYYQSRIPLKDSALMSRAEDPALRREWRQRVGSFRPGARAGTDGQSRDRQQVSSERRS